MEKISCEIIRDLLPLYNDEVCSEDSRRIVETHLEQCGDCQRLLERIRLDCRIGDIQEQKDETLIKDLSVGWKRSVKRNFIKGVLAALCACLLLAGILLGLWRLPLVQVPADCMQATVTSVTETMVNVHLEAIDGKSVRYMTTKVTDDGRLYIIVKRSIISTKQSPALNWDAEVGIPRTYVTEMGAQVVVQEIYYGDTDKSELVWAE